MISGCCFNAVVLLPHVPHTYIFITTLRTICLQYDSIMYFKGLIIVEGNICPLLRVENFNEPF